MVRRFIYFIAFFAISFVALFAVSQNFQWPQNLKEIIGQKDFSYSYRNQAEFRSENRVKEIRAQIKMEPESSSLWLKLSEALYEQAAFSSNNILMDQAYSAAIKAQKLEVHSGLAVLLQGFVLLYRDLPFHSIERANWVMANHPKLHRRALELRARSFVKLGRLDAAFTDAELLSQTQPSLKNLSLLATIVGHKGEVAEAIDLYSKALEFERPDEYEHSLRARQAIAKLLLQQGFTDLAKEVITVLEKMEPHEPATLFLQAELSWLNKAPYSARAQLQAAINKTENFDYRLRLAQLERILGNGSERERLLENLEKHVRESIRLGFYNERMTLIKVLSAIGGEENIDEAQQILKNSENRSPQLAHMQFRLKFLSGDITALDDFRRISTKPSAEQLFMLGRIHEAQNNWLSSLWYFSRTLWENPYFQPKKYGYAAFPWAEWLGYLN